jgi:hypothetical protein
MPSRKVAAVEQRGPTVLDHVGGIAVRITIIELRALLLGEKAGRG